MAKLTNREIVTNAKNNGIIQDVLANAILSGVASDILDSQAMTNGFVDFLNRIVKLKTYGITTVNRWKKLYKDRIEFGTGMDFLVVGKATDTDSYNLKDSSSYRYYSMQEPYKEANVDELKDKPQMTNKYRQKRICKNRYAVSISDEWITYAMVNQYGIDEVTTYFMSANDKAVEIDTDNDAYDFIVHSWDHGTNINGENPLTYREGSFGDISDARTDENLKGMLGLIHNVSSEMALTNAGTYSDGVEQNTDFDKQLLIIDYHIYNLLKTRLYSGAFNLSELKIPIDNIILVDMGFSYDGSNTSEHNIQVQDGDNFMYALICHEDRYQIRDIKNLSKARYNEGGLYTNVFKHLDREIFEVYGKQALALTMVL